MNWKVRCAAGLLAAAALACTPAWASRAEVVTVGAEDDWFPYSGLVNGEGQGITLDIVRAAFAAVGIDVKFEVMPYARCMALTKSGRLLACFDTLRHPGIENDYLWHDPPMFKVQYRIYAPADSPEQNLRAADLEGRRVAVTRAYEYGTEFDTDEKIVRVFSPRDESNFGMVLRGRAEYTLALDINTRLLMKRHPEFAGRFKIVGAVAESGVYTVFSRLYPDSRRLMARFEQGLRAIIRSGRVQAIQDDWLARLTGGSRR